VTLEKTITFNRDNKFDIQLSKALICERRLAEIFRFGEFDTTIELKSESWQWRRTGNIAIEYLCDGKPSGISVCKADWWVHELCDDDGATLLYIVVAMDRLKALARAAIRDGRSRQGGDDKRYRMAIINVSDLLTLALPEQDRCQLSPK
jgi:hypothetical protein